VAVSIIAIHLIICELPAARPNRFDPAHDNGRDHLTAVQLLGAAPAGRPGFSPTSRVHSRNWRSRAFRQAPPHRGQPNGLDLDGLRRRLGGGFWIVSLARGKIPTVGIRCRTAR
jgi:hypothetical protein